MSKQMSDAAEMLWVVLANVSGGDWTQQTTEWQEAAARWRDNYFAALKSRAAEGDDNEPLHTGDDERLDCVTNIRASLEEIIDEEGKPECDHCADLLSSALDSCETLDALIIATIKRERLAAEGLVSSPASQQQTLREWAAANTCSEVHEGTLCSVCRYAGVGCVRAWALNDGAAETFEQMDARIKADVQRDEPDHD